MRADCTPFVSGIRGVRTNRARSALGVRKDLAADYTCGQSYGPCLEKSSLISSRSLFEKVQTYGHKQMPV